MADVWRTEFEGQIYSVHADLAGAFSVGQTVQGEYVFGGTPSVADIAYVMQSFDVTFPAYTLQSTANELTTNDSVGFSNDLDFGHPLVDVTDLYSARVDSFSHAPPVAGIPVTYLVVRLEQRGAPPIDVFNATDIMFAPPDLNDITYLKYGVLQFDGFRNVEFAITAIRMLPPPVVDADQDGVPDVHDNCPNVPNADQADTDLDGQGDACDGDDDNDGVADAGDNCPLSVGLGPNQTDTDHDGVGDLCDADIDGDGVANADDICPVNPDPDQSDNDGDGPGDACDPDDDNDTVCDIGESLAGVCGSGPDNCPLTANTGQSDLDNDSIGDTCDEDLDGDGVENNSDNCPATANDGTDTDQDGDGDACDADDDNDGVLDVADNCALVANADQADADHDGIGNACNNDDDQDSDEWVDALDNCPTIVNGNQHDFDADGIGNACDADDDNDAVADGTDLCPDSPLGVPINSASGCSLEQSCPCDGPRGTTEPWRNHGAYVSCVAHATTNLVNEGLMASTQRSALVSVAGQSICGKK